MDGVLRAVGGYLYLNNTPSFNPCSNGWCTSRMWEAVLILAILLVSILVLMDGVLRERV